MLDTTGSDEMSSPFKLMLIFCLCCFFSPAHGFGLNVYSDGNIREGTGDAYISLSVQNGTEVNVTINTVDMTATAGEDYEAITDRRVTFSADLPDYKLTVHIINDTLMEPSETFLVTVNGSSLSKNLTITVNIEDDDHPVNSDCHRLGEYCLDGGSSCYSNGVCWCLYPHTGPNCAINSDHIQGGPGCGSLDCVHGTCMSNGTLATCACDRNYTGDLCDRDRYFHQCNPNNISICLSPPQNSIYSVTDVYVTGYRNTADCNLTLAPTPPDPSDGIVDWCEGYAGVFDYNTTCGEVDSITEGGLSISVLRMNITVERMWVGSFSEEVTFRCPKNYGMEAEDEPCCQPDPGMENAVNTS
ncbi:uncharacterized protein LOC124152911 isoform X2 [Haliotis rufescens]|uniref:uncharacterized protein LOC124152911 isoform X2 n=1 Tax=Haliotis rufescens TaxID=6454 RepID=UPI00201F6326|nr:uncharacterized protein LOC124152911 isoform X2 [Haliotis rufescens]XP_048238549.1 uncharacterized protein LOC124152911 isoform X2 [Haliotis rufescens]XP_048238550.1 uncharacterized protein LOC124152911 isoform X2 [Haliotis rufescens]XP_048238551.1 uncharacterized protein LOC124152911 isoform X2 [Haliotis rufescens]